MFIDIFSRFFYNYLNCLTLKLDCLCSLIYKNAFFLISFLLTLIFIDIFFQSFYNRFNYLIFKLNYLCSLAYQNVFFLIFFYNVNAC